MFIEIRADYFYKKKMIPLAGRKAKVIKVVYKPRQIKHFVVKVDSKIYEIPPSCVMK